MKIAKYLIIFVFLGSMAIVFGDRGLVDYHKLSRHLQDLETQNAKLKTQNDNIERQITLLRDDPAFIEATARNELGMARPDELIFRFTR